MRRLLALAVLAVSACHGHDHTFDTFEACVEDHTADGLSEANSITHCLVDYPFGDGLTTMAECVEYVTEHGGYPDSRDEGCADFLEMTGP